MNIIIVITNLILAHAPLPEFVDVPEQDLVQAIHATWTVKPDVAKILAKGALLGGRLGSIHPAWLLSMAHFESRFRFSTKGDCYLSKSGKKKCRAYGLCQIHYHTGKSVLKGVTRRDLLKPIINLAVAGLLYRKYIIKYGRRKAHVFYACGNRCPHCISTPSFKRRYKLMKKLINNIKGN